MWYVIQTLTGKESELVGTIYKLLPNLIFNKCFIIKRQMLKRLGGEWVEITENLFPSYVFLDTQVPEALFYELKHIPEYTKLLGNGQGVFIPLEMGEEQFLIKLYQEESTPVVKLSQIILDEAHNINEIDGPLGKFKHEIIRLNLRKRYAVVETAIGGKKQQVMLGIRLEKDR